MHFVVHALDRPDALPRRQAVLAAHRTYLDTAPARHGVQVLMSGPLITDDGETMIGSFFLLDAESREAVEAMFAEDPMSQADVWAARDLHMVMIRQNAMGEAAQTR